MDESTGLTFKDVQNKLYFLKINFQH